MTYPTGNQTVVIILEALIDDADLLWIRNFMERSCADGLLF